MRMPGMSKNSVLRLLAELGPDFVEKFPDARHFESWANLVPNNKISGGKSAVKQSSKQEQSCRTGVQTMR